MNNKKIYQCSGTKQLGKYTINYQGNYIDVFNSIIDGKQAILITNSEVSDLRGTIILTADNKLQFSSIFMGEVKAKIKGNIISITCNHTY